MEGGGEAGDAILGEEMNIGETNREFADRMGGRDDRYALMRKLGNREYIDEHTTVPDTRTTDEILSRVPKCCRKPKDETV